VDFEANLKTTCNTNKKNSTPRASSEICITFNDPPGLEIPGIASQAV